MINEARTMLGLNSLLVVDALGHGELPASNLNIRHYLMLLHALSYLFLSLPSVCRVIMSSYYVERTGVTQKPDP
jgi:hypothetical protein